MHIGGGHQFPFGHVKLTIAHHGSTGPNGEALGNPVGVVLTMGGKKIYHAGDTGLFLDMQLIGEAWGPLDVALLPIGDNFTMGIDDAVRAAGFLRRSSTSRCTMAHLTSSRLIRGNSRAKPKPPAAKRWSSNPAPPTRSADLPRALECGDHSPP